MGLVWVIIEILALIFFPPLGIALILGKWIFWAVKKKILIDVYFIYILFLGVPQVLLWWLMGVLHIIFVNFGLNIFKFSLHWIEIVFDNIHESIQVIENYSKEAASFLLFWGTIVVVFIQPPMSADILENLYVYGTIFGFIFVPLIIGSALLNYIKGGKLAQAKQKAAAGAQKAMQGPQQVRGQMQSMPGERGSAGDVSEGVHRDLHRAETAEKTAKKAEGVLRKADGGIKWIPGNVKTAIVNLVKTLPGGKAIVKGGGKTAKKAAGRKLAKKGAEKAAIAGEAAESVSLLPAILIILLVAPLLWGLQAALIGGTFVGMVNVWAPMVMGPAMDAVGLGAAYGDWIGGEAANSEAAIGLTQGDWLEPQKRAIAQAGAKMKCMLEGPQCLRQWQMNNTVRPGSESRGETYELKISQFGLGTESVDVAYKEADYTLPVNFLVENTRNGLKGINARNVSYKISVVDSSKTYCTTGWENITSFNEDSSRNYILPGLGVSPVGSMEELNLGDCQLLQPSLGINRVMEMQVRYNYASQATLYADAMSRENRREQGIEPGFKKSKTAKTPVQSYINVKSPITFYETEGGERNSVPFGARFGFDTPGFDAKYRIRPESIQIVDSSVTTDTGTCNGLEPDSDKPENYYEISDRAKERINLRQDNSWFSAEAEPAPLRGTMKIEKESLGQISPTGEQLVMRIDGNYTIVKQDQMAGFDVKNTLCARNNCPLLVTEEYNRTSPYHLYSKCTSGTSVDTRGGCSVRMPNSSGMNWRLPNLAEDSSGNTITLSQGTVARRLDTFLNDVRDYVDLYGSVHSTTSSEAESRRGGDTVPVGVPQEENTERETRNSKGAVFYEEDGNENNIRIETLEKAVCTQGWENTGDSTDDVITEYLQEWNSEEDGEALSIVVKSVDCSRSIGEFLRDSFDCAAGNYVNTWSATAQFVDPTQSIDDDTFENRNCESTGEQLNSCDGVLVQGRSSDLECYAGGFE